MDLTVTGLDPDAFDGEVERSAGETPAGGVTVTVTATYRGTAPAEARLRVSASIAAEEQVAAGAAVIDHVCAPAAITRA